jgi:hypothetical protein
MPEVPCSTGSTASTGSSSAAECTGLSSVGFSPERPACRENDCGFSTHTRIRSRGGTTARRTPAWSSCVRRRCTTSMSSPSDGCRARPAPGPLRLSHRRRRARVGSRVAREWSARRARTRPRRTQHCRRSNGSIAPDDGRPRLMPTRRAGLACGWRGARVAGRSRRRCPPRTNCDASRQDSMFAFDLPTGG